MVQNLSPHFRINNLKNFRVFCTKFIKGIISVYADGPVSRVKKFHRYPSSRQGSTRKTFLARHPRTRRTVGRGRVYGHGDTTVKGRPKRSHCFRGRKTLEEGGPPTGTTGVTPIRTAQNRGTHPDRCTLTHQSPGTHPDRCVLKSTKSGYSPRTGTP